jgi:hypothetical protein
VWDGIVEPNYPKAHSAHEAAHSICALQVGAVVRDVSIDRASWAEWANSTPGPGQDAKNLLMNLVGQVAENKALGKSSELPSYTEHRRLMVRDATEGGVPSDNMNTARSLARLSESLEPEHVAEVYAAAAAASVRWVEKNWADIAKVATALERKGKLSGREVEGLVRPAH